jgi:predicted O-linked N-acetylglucosamine transferase (SPINDLY family)
MSGAVDELLRQAVDAHGRGAIEAAKEMYRRVLELNARSVTACSNLAIIAAQSGELVQAEALFRRAVQQAPNAPEGFNNLGMLLLQQGRLDEAIAAHRRALALRPDYPAAHCGLGNALGRQGKLDDAAAAYRHALKSKPDHAEAWNNLGVVLQQQGKLAEALDAYGRASTLRPDDLEAAYNVAVVLQRQGRLADAEAAYRQVIGRGANALVYVNLGSVQLELGWLDDALAAFEQALALDSAYAPAHYNRGLVLQQQGRLDGALACYRHAVALKPDFLEAITNAGIVLQELGRPGEAVMALRQAVTLRPDAPEPRNNLGVALLACGQPADAVTEFQQALARKPDYAEAFSNLGNAWRELDRPEGAIAAYAQAVRLRPDDADAFGQLAYQRWRACDWTDYQSDQQKLLDLARQGARIPPFFLLSTPATPAEQLACARRWNEPLGRSAPAALPPRLPTDRSRIRLGYLSADFHQHATAYLAAELFERHDRSRFEVIAYSYGPDDGSAMRRRLMEAFDRFVDIRPLSHAQGAARIHADEIDILVDLKGHTLNARPAILAARPAPVQVNYLGYPGTMGARFIDYLLADGIVAPQGEQEFFSEQLVELPGCYQPNDSRRAIAETPSRRDCGLPPDGLVFCCFNNTYKISPAFFDMWTRVLKKVPASVLWLLESNALARRNLRREAERRGVDPDRLVFAPIKPIAEHLARHRHADLFLDTLPCNAHTTASDALWAGLPVLTCAGDTFAGRVAASLNTAIGLPELIAPSLDGYERLAIELARAPQRLKELRAKLTADRESAPLFDIAAYVRHIEAAYARMVDIWRAGEKPRPFAVDA